MSAWLKTLVVSSAAVAFGGAASAAEDSMDAVLGKALFERPWVSAPSSTKAADGLGPLFNARACSSCHQGGGRAAVSLQEGDLPASAGLAVRVGAVKDGKLAPHPELGLQVQTMAVPGLKPEGSLRLSFESHTEQLADGTTVELRRPRFAIMGEQGSSDLAWISPRLAPDLHGSGLLERVPLSRLAALADPDDLNGDGISGSIAMGHYGELDIEPGRFGWKGDEPDLVHQISAAFHFDLGLATPLRPDLWGDCTIAEADCLAAPHGAAPGSVEIESNIVALVVTYLRALPAPAGSRPNADVSTGETIFAKIGCGSCHTPQQQAELASGEMMWFSPYSDLLVHDMGEGLADRAADGSVSPVAGARDWRTAPLWGLGPRVAAKDGANLLHDGRARSVLEAILWHGGEAAQAKQRAVELSAQDRAALIAFLEGL
ncbi:di-heme oxidoredictase family protein [Dongia deserti]|uniref:di-heme oxidoredictase family protein n=1 Tax=Dongia deserti TaxID=2268030 RepID=UPI000E64CD61|nr:di-heme oxidoredictase family protein [Dongia deserti]